MIGIHTTRSLEVWLRFRGKMVYIEDIHSNVLVIILRRSLWILIHITAEPSPQYQGGDLIAEPIVVD